MASGMNMAVGEIPGNVYARYQLMQRYVGWTEADAARVRSLRDLLQPEFDTVVSDFYATIQAEPEAARVITGGSVQIERLKVTLYHWLEELFCGTYDSAYVMRRWRVGWRHVDIGLDQVLNNMALSRMRSLLLSSLIQHWRGTADDLHAASRSLGQLLDLDLAIIEDAYQAEHVKRLQHAERLATIGQIAAGITHELRNPLNVIKTSVYYLLHTRNSNPDKISEHLGRIERQVGNANAVITALSNFARLPVPELQTVPLRPCIEETLEECGLSPGSSLGSEVSPTPIPIPTVELSVEEGLPPLLGDPDQLRIVFSNLLRNARDATGTNGQISVTAQRDTDRIRIDFSDNGCGISPDNLRHVGEPLFTTKARGLGLGLAISKAIVRKHGGEWSVNSQLGHGTTFTLRLPFSANDSGQP